MIMNETSLYVHQSYYDELMLWKAIYDEDGLTEALPAKQEGYNKSFFEMRYRWLHQSDLVEYSVYEALYNEKKKELKVE